MKIAFLTYGDPLDRKEWSGTIHSEYQQLSKYYDVEPIIVKLDPALLKLVRTKERIKYIFTRKTYIPIYSSQRLLKQAAKTIMPRLSEFDLIFAAATSTVLPFVQTDKPIVYMSDAVFDLMLDYYFFNLNSLNIKNGRLYERYAIQMSAASIFASDWAKSGAIKYYNADPDKCYVLPLGANTDDMRRDKPRTLDKVINILFIGADWKRKGGDLAVQTLQELNSRNTHHEYTLYLIGGKPDYEISDPHIHIYGFLDKNKEDDREKFYRVLENADVFLLPTVAECAGIAFSEASAMGLPVVTHDTGGIAAYVHNGFNGITLPLSATAADFADNLQSIVESQDRYSYFSNNAISLSKTSLNWDKWGEQAKAIIDNVMSI